MHMGKTTCETFGQANPDSNLWVCRLARHFQVKTVAGLCDKLGYKAPIEFLAMHLCFAASPSLDKYDFEQVGRSIGRLQNMQTMIFQ